MNSHRLIDIANLLEIPPTYVRDVFRNMGIEKIPGTKQYTFYQIEVARQQLTLQSGKEIFFDFDAQKITIIKHSKLCLD